MYFVYSGRLDEQKGIKILFEAWNKEDVPLLKVCGIGLLENWCKTYIRNNKLKSIEMLGFVSNSQVKHLIANSAALILPTQWYEGFPMSIIEAYSVGTPVICSDFGNAGSIVQENVTGYKFHPGSPTSIIAAVKKQINNPLNKEKIMKVYCEKYSREVNYMILKNVYEKVIY